MNRQEVRMLTYSNGFKLWQVAEKLNISDLALSKKLRHSLSDEDTQKVYQAIEELKTEQKAQ